MKNMWMLYGLCVYSCNNTISEDQKTPIENDLFKQMINLFVVTYGHDFDYRTQPRSMGCGCGWYLWLRDQRPRVVDKALYGLNHKVRRFLSAT
ncbi:hypothetical protein OK016_01020 [Vibrio chagasii]|nr:hypothetical protein [Vibrio chagasii]